MNSTDSPTSSSPSTSSATQSGRVESSIATSVRDTADKAKRAASDAVDQAKSKVSEVAGQQKDAAAQSISGYGSALRESARSMQDQDPNIAHFANQAADRIDQVANYVRTADFGRIRQDAENVARRHPALFMGGMLMAGLVLGNLAKTSVQSINGGGNDSGDDEENSDRSASSSTRDGEYARNASHQTGDQPDDSLGSGFGSGTAAADI